MYATTSILAIGAIPHFMDVEVDTRCVSSEHVASALDKGVDGVIVTHLYGLAAPQMADIASLCKSANVPLLEDCAQAHGARVDGKCAGAFADASCFSFYPTKNLGALGDGGAVATANANIAERVKRLRQYGWASKYRVVSASGRNSRLDELQAAVLHDLLPYLDENNEARRAIALRYTREIRHSEVAAPQYAGANFVSHLYVVRSPRRDALREHLEKCGIGSDIHYPIPDYRQPVFAQRYSDVFLPATEKLTSEILTLPCYPELPHDIQTEIIAAINSWRA
jgi:dTDP-4-amino-4,6-dideoxygalactose transaminase